ncbi:MAG: metallophosphoesterase [Planctomycetota bacterium]
MATWVLGDIHGCAQELSELVETLALARDDRLLCVGDLFHRGPDPLGVMDLLQEHGALFILGNHELVVLERFGLAPRLSDGSDRPALRTSFPPLEEGDLAGDGNIPCALPAERRKELLVFLQGHLGFFAENTGIEGAGPTADGRAWCAVHAGLVPGRSPAECRPAELIRLRRLTGRGKPYWYEVYSGPNLVLFGHTPGSIPRAQREGGRLVALGLDTGCVYGGQLTAYCPEEDRFVQVKAARAWARK